MGRRRGEAQGAKHGKIGEAFNKRREGTGLFKPDDDQ